MNKSSIQAYILVGFAILCWASIEIVMKLIQSNSSALLMNFFRFCIGCLFLFGVAITTHRIQYYPRYLRFYWKPLFFASSLGLALGMFLFALGTTLTQASLAAAIISANPLIISTYMMVWQGESRSKLKIIGIILGFIGVLVIITQLNFTALMNPDYILGNILVFIGTILWSIDLIIGKLLLKNTSQYPDLPAMTSLDFNTLTFLGASIMMLPFVFLIPSELESMLQMSPVSWGGLFYLGILPTGIGYLAFFLGLRKIDASQGINLFYLKPIFATIMAFLILHEIPSLFLYIGIGIEFLALFLVTR